MSNESKQNKPDCPLIGQDGNIFNLQCMTNEINRLLDSENADKDKVEALIIRCAQLKYMTICEVRT